MRLTHWICNLTSRSSRPSRAKSRRRNKPVSTVTALTQTLEKRELLSAS